MLYHVHPDTMAEISDKKVAIQAAFQPKLNLLYSGCLTHFNRTVYPVDESQCRIVC